MENERTRRETLEILGIAMCGVSSILFKYLYILNDEGMRDQYTCKSVRDKHWWYYKIILESSSMHMEKHNLHNIDQFHPVIPEW